MNSEITSFKILYRKEMLFKLLLYFLVLMSLVFISSNILKVKTVAFFLFLLAILPFLFINKVVDYFSKQASFKITEDQFEVLAKGKEQRNSVIKSNIIRFNEIQAYQIQFPNSKTSSIRFKYKTGRSVEYVLIRQNIGLEKFDLKELMDRIHFEIKSYNTQTQATSKNKILFEPSFMASKSGKICIIGLIFLFSTSAILQIILHSKIFPATFLIGFGVIFQLFYTRINDLKYYKSITD